MTAPPTRRAMRWGPDAKAAAVSITLDNLGEAMDLSIGSWPDQEPVGRHYSVLDVLPRILECLDAVGARCTYFAEGWSADLYPEALKRLGAGGHEVAYHGWRHEHWPSITSREQEAELIARGVTKMAEHGITLRGFRPPGGVMTAWTPELLREHGFSYISPAGSRAGVLPGSIAALPFRWRTIDAYYFFDAFRDLRQALGDGAEPLKPDRFVAEVEQVLDEIVSDHGYVSVLFHPFLENEPARFDAMRRIITTVLEHDDIWCAPCQEHAQWLISQPGQTAMPPKLDQASWR